MEKQAPIDITDQLNEANVILTASVFACDFARRADGPTIDLDATLGFQGKGGPFRFMEPSDLLPELDEALCSIHLDSSLFREIKQAMIEERGKEISVGDEDLELVIGLPKNIILLREPDVDGSPCFLVASPTPKAPSPQLPLFAEPQEDKLQDSERPLYYPISSGGNILALGIY
jgi:hypothetical protein